MPSLHFGSPLRSTTKRISCSCQQAALAAVIERAAEGGFKDHNRAFEAADRAIESGHSIFCDLLGIPFGAFEQLLDHMLENFRITQCCRDAATLFCSENCVCELKITRYPQ